MADDYLEEARKRGAYVGGFLQNLNKAADVQRRIREAELANEGITLSAEDVAILCWNILILARGARRAR